jgi:hypothetical protein
MISHIVANLTATYPRTRLSLNTDSSEWLFNNAGGAMGAMYVIHASITEYLIIFGTPLGTEGHSGLHSADDYFHILVGEQWAFQPGALEMERYVPGDVHLMRRGVAKQYKMHEGCWAMEYARGVCSAISCHLIQRRLPMFISRLQVGFRSCCRSASRTHSRLRLIFQHCTTLFGSQDAR